MEKKIRVGIFGGFRGFSYYNVISKYPGFCVSAICDKNPALPAEHKDVLLPETVICTTFEEMLAVGIDAVILANYFHEHARYAIRAMEAGIDVISETTAAPTLGECLDLLECAERTGRKYMLAANCPTMVGPDEVGRVYRSGQMGEVYYAEAEYLHRLSPADPKVEARFFPGALHWRRFLPGTYYNMHSLGVLMAMTGLLPRRVNAVEIYNKNAEAVLKKKANKTVGGIALYEMENGAIFRSTGCCSFGPDGKWYRLSCERGTVETQRQNQDKVLLRFNDMPVKEYDPENQYTEVERCEGHGGADYRVCRAICEYLLGHEQPFFDVYRAVALSLAGIYGLYSILAGGRAFDIPDPHDKAAREVLRGDYRTPFPDEDGKATLPCAAHEPNMEIPEL